MALRAQVQVGFDSVDFNFVCAGCKVLGADFKSLIRNQVEPTVGLEPTTCCLQDSCSAS